MSSSEDVFISLPENFENILNSKKTFYTKVLNLLSSYSIILEENEHKFFPGYTDHGIKHIDSVLADAERLIPSSIFQKLTPEEIGVFAIAVALHDIGMQASPDLFGNMLKGKYDEERIGTFDDKTWKELWDEYKNDYQYWDNEKKENVFGKKDCIIDIPTEDELHNLNDNQKKFIGEFLRLHHCRNAHEIAIHGYDGNENIAETTDVDFKKYVDLAGLVARSHGMDMRKTFPYLEKKYIRQWNEPLSIHVVYLMVLLRVADAMQIDNTRTSRTHLAVNKIDSPFSQLEHEAHLATEPLIFHDDEEIIYVQAEPKNARIYVKIEHNINVLQRELDQSWAILGEVYRNKYSLNYRRVHCDFVNQDIYNFVPQQFSYRFNDSLAKKLVGPLYGNNPSFGVRELVQNAVDACRECKEKDEKDPPHVVVKLDTVNNLFTITDTGKGMTLEEIQKYFLTIGSSFNDNIDWKKWRDDKKTYRSGRFGIGVLAAFLLGDKICVETRSKDGKTGYTFEAELGDKFIEIKTNDKLPFGTTIKIECDSECISQLQHLATNENTIYYNQWLKWYIDKEPAVTYFLNDKQFIPKLNLEGYKKLTHSSKLFGDVFWKNPILDEIIQPSLYCNGFLITTNSEKCLFSQDIISHFPFKLPHLQIIDKYNKLPIDLKRTSIDSTYIYDFEKELAIESSKDLICQLMGIEIKSTIETVSICSLAFSHKDFFINSSYAKKIIKGKKIIHIWSDDMFTEINEWNKVFKKYSEYYFQFHLFYPDVNFFETFNMLRNNSKVILYSTSDDPSFKFDDSIYPHKREYKECIILAKNTNDLNIFDYIIDFLLSGPFIMDPFYFFIEEINVNETSSSIPELDNVFEKYLGNDPLIPYNLKERKKKFPLIHNEFPDEIEYYRKIYQEKNKN